MTTARSDVAEGIKQALTMEDVVRKYGFEPSRTGFIQCPFHQGDHTASLKLYPGGRGWCCFGCHKGGSVIDFVMELYDISFVQAVARISLDFGLGLDTERPSPTARSKALEARRRAAERVLRLREEYAALARGHLFLREYIRLFPPTREDWDEGKIDPVYAMAAAKLPELEQACEELSRVLAEEKVING